MSQVERCGIYVIEHSSSGNCYIGSSVSIRRRWGDHRRLLRKEKHHSPRLQNAWNTYGEDAFDFWILEDCSFDELLSKEQQYLEAFKPIFNASSAARVCDCPEIKARRRELAALRTHCPHGHVYDEANTYLGRKGEKICRACANFRTTAVYALETPEQREKRRLGEKERYQRFYDERRRKANEYAAAHREAKRAYDKARRESGVIPRLLRANMTPERRDYINAQQRKNHLKRKMRAIT